MRKTKMAKRRWNGQKTTNWKRRELLFSPNTETEKCAIQPLITDPLTQQLLSGQFCEGAPRVIFGSPLVR